jgi:hypothetical protein
VQRGFFSIILAGIAISLGVGAAMHADNRMVRIALVSVVAGLTVGVLVWLVAWCLPSMFGEWRKLAVAPGVCPNCAFEVRVGEEACPECGHRLTLFAALRREEEAAAVADEGGDTKEPPVAVEVGATAQAGAAVEASEI